MSIHDLVIIGGGPAGVGTAHFLQGAGLDVQILEQEKELGGRTKSVMLPGGAANMGAQFVYTGTPTQTIADELGLESIPFEPGTHGVAFEGAVSVAESNAEIVAGLPLNPAERRELEQFLDEAVAEYREMTEGGELTDRSRSLADVTVAERLAGQSPTIREIITTAVRAGAVGEPAELVAQYALRYFASYVAHDCDNRRLLCDGMQSIVLRLAQSLPAAGIHTSTSATAVAADPGGGTYTITASTAEGNEKIFKARQVLLAVPSPMVLRLASELPRWKTAAIEAVRTPGNTTMVIAADASEAPEYRDWGMVTTPGHRFDCILNAAPGRWREKRAPGIVHFTCYANRLGHQPDLPGDPASQAEWIEDFLSVAPGLRGRIRGYRFQTWEHCFSLLSRERLAVLDELRRSVGGLHFAGDWTSETAGTHGAFVEARRSAAEVKARSSASSRRVSAAQSCEPD